jgi:multidrug efflux pump subunit AcrA (membrane-fusion protein)
MSKNRSRGFILGVIIVVIVHSTTPLIINAADKNQDLFIDALKEEDVSKTYTTETITKQELITGSQIKGTISFSAGDDVTLTDNYEGMYFISYLVEYGQMVKKGDPIAELGVSLDKDNVEELKLSLQREEDNLAAYTGEYETLSKQYTEDQSSLSKALLSRLQTTYQVEKLSREANINQLKKQYQDYLDLEKNDFKIHVKATCNGMILNYGKLVENDKVETGAYIESIADINKVLISVTDDLHVLKYNMPVTVTQGKNSLKGHVITGSSKLLSPNLLSEDTLIEVEDLDLNRMYSKEVTVEYNSVDMKNVLVVDSSNVFKDEYGSYIYLLIDGLRKKQYIICGASNKSKTWIIRGAKEGDSVIVNES